MASVSLRLRHRADAVIGVIWALGMALGIVLLDLTPGYRADLMSYLFGSILAVPSRDLYMMLGLDALVILAVGYFYHDLVAISYDDEFARVRGVPVTGLYYLLMILIAVTVVMLIQVVGMILVIAMLTIPPFIAEKMVRSMGRMIGLSVLLNLGFTLVGLALAYAYDLTSGAAIILVAASCFFLTLGIQRLRGR
jgi:zinc transport system permease protein